MSPKGAHERTTSPCAHLLEEPVNRSVLFRRANGLHLKGGIPPGICCANAPGAVRSSTVFADQHPARAPSPSTQAAGCSAPTGVGPIPVKP